MKPKSFTIFDWIKAIVDTKPDWSSFTQDQHKLFNNYMVLKFLSMNEQYIEPINYIQGLGIKDSKKLYKLLCALIPRSKRTFYPYIKSQNKNEDSEEVAKYITEFFECSTKEAYEYLKLMDKSWVKEILEKKGVDEKQIKKLIK